jgi:hypothetical protein
MGHGGWTSRDWDDFKTTNTTGRATAAIFTSRGMPRDMDPKYITVRESRDSADNPNSTPIILALDVTGSMGVIADTLAREGLGVLVQQILDRKPLSDPHIMVMGVGDAAFDQAPLQISQFEADIRIADQLKQIYLEHGGGGNHFESYNFPWYFAARKTDIDSIAKRGQKGLLFTFGDEECPMELKAEHIRHFIGDDVQTDISTTDLLAMVQQKYDVFHVVVEQGSHARSNRDRVYNSWNSVLPQGRIVPLKDYAKVAEVVVSVLEVHAGRDVASVVRSWDGGTALVVAEATKDVVPAGRKADGSPGVWRPGN